jgi:AraC-like DNA-binding protein
MRRQLVDVPYPWAEIAFAPVDRVEVIQLRDGVTLLLNEIAPGEECEYHCVEPEDVFGIGFHLSGGSRFDMEGNRFDTRPLEVHAGAAPRSSTSSFVLPAHGFRTVSLRFSPEAAADLLARHGLADSSLAAMVARTSVDIAAARLSPLDSAGVSLVNAMFAAPYAGAGRTLYLESCALALLAAQFNAAESRSSDNAKLPSERALAAARAYLDAHLGDPPTTMELARICGMNDFTLKRGFKAAFGITIFGYVRQRRMERAASDLHAGMSVAEASFQAGYECPRCFADAFRRHYGLLPSEVTRAALGKTPAHRG